MEVQWVPSAAAISFIFLYLVCIADLHTILRRCTDETSRCIAHLHNDVMIKHRGVSLIPIHELKTLNL